MQAYFSLPAEDLAAVDLIAEREHDGNRSEVLRAAVREYLHGPAVATRTRGQWQVVMTITEPGRESAEATAARLRAEYLPDPDVAISTQEPPA